MNRNDTRLHLRISTSEKEALQAKALSHGVSVGEYVRRVVIESEPAVVTCRECQHRRTQVSAAIAILSRV